MRSIENVVDVDSAQARSDGAQLVQVEKANELLDQVVVEITTYGIKESLIKVTKLNIEY